MSAVNEALARRLRQFDRFLPIARNSPPQRRQPLPSAAYRAETAAPASLAAQPDLDRELARLNRDEIPENTALLGICDDGLPFLLDLSNPAPGALLLTGDPGSGKTALLHALLASLVHLNTPRQAVFNLIAVQPDEYSNLESQPQCRRSHPVEHPEAPGLIEELKGIVEDRKRTGPQDPAILLVIDDLASLLSFLDEPAYNSLYWLIRHGPRYKVWTLAALSSTQVREVEPRFLTAFRTRLFGHVQDERLAQRLAGGDRLSTRRLQMGKQCLIPYGEGWLRFWIWSLDRPRPQAERDDDYGPDGLEGDVL